MNVTITITRKFLTILISNVAFGHQLSGMQWFGCGLVFIGMLAKPVLKATGETENKPLKKTE